MPYWNRNPETHKTSFVAVVLALTLARTWPTFKHLKTTRPSTKPDWKLQRMSPCVILWSFCPIFAQIRSSAQATTTSAPGSTVPAATLWIPSNVEAEPVSKTWRPSAAQPTRFGVPTTTSASAALIFAVHSIPKPLSSAKQSTSAFSINGSAAAICFQALANTWLDAMMNLNACPKAQVILCTASLKHKGHVISQDSPYNALLMVSALEISLNAQVLESVHQATTCAQMEHVSQV